MRIRIGPFDYKVSFKDQVNEDDRRGECNHETLEINLRTGMKAQRQAEVLLHETMHGIFDASGLDDIPGIAKHEETIVTALGVHLLQVIRDNPALIEILKDAA